MLVAVAAVLAVAIALATQPHFDVVDFGTGYFAALVAVVGSAMLLFATMLGTLKGTYLDPPRQDPQPSYPASGDSSQVQTNA
jgi:hypothetical protein